MSRSGDWIATATGLKWFITDPDARDVRIEDIAHALSLTCRFGGHCREFYSVAQHSAHVADVIREEHPTDHHLELWGLMHDATEAYVGDMVRPLKLSMPKYKALEDYTEAVICEAFGILVPPDVRAAVKRYDDVLLMTERRDLIKHCGHEWTPRAEPWWCEIKPWTQEQAKHTFLLKFRFLATRLGLKGVAFEGGHGSSEVAS